MSEHHHIDAQRSSAQQVSALRLPLAGKRVAIACRWLASPSRSADIFFLPLVN